MCSFSFADMEGKDIIIAIENRYNQNFITQIRLLAGLPDPMAQ